MLQTGLRKYYIPMIEKNYFNLFGKAMKKL